MDKAARQLESAINRISSDISDLARSWDDAGRRPWMAESGQADREANGRTAMPRTLRAGAFSREPRQLRTIERLKAWTRTHFALDPAAAVMVVELACTRPGCPPLETVIAFWIDEQRRRFKIFKSMGEVRRSDLPPAWLRDVLAS